MNDLLGRTFGIFSSCLWVASSLCWLFLLLCTSLLVWYKPICLILPLLPILLESYLKKNHCLYQQLEFFFFEKFHSFLKHWFMCMIKDKFHFLTYGKLVFLTPFIEKKKTFFQCMFLKLLLKIKWAAYMEIFFRFSILFHWPMCQFLYPYNTIWLLQP